MAKSGMLGFTYSVAREGLKNNIFCNCIAPIAATRMTETVMSKDILDMLKVDYIVPLVGFLSHENCKESGSVFEVGGRWVAKLRWQRSEGDFFLNEFTSENIEKSWEKICCFEKNATFPNDGSDGIKVMVDATEKAINLAKNKTAEKLKSEDVISLIKAYLGGEEGKKEPVVMRLQLARQEVLDKSPHHKHRRRRPGDHRRARPPHDRADGDATAEQMRGTRPRASHR